MFDVVASGIERHRRGPSSRSEEVPTWGNGAVEGPQNRLNSASEAVPLHRATCASSDGERDARVFERWIGGVQHPEDPAANSPTAPERGEVRTVATTMDQALSR